MVVHKVFRPKMSQNGPPLGIFAKIKSTDPEIYRHILFAFCTTWSLTLIFFAFLCNNQSGGWVAWFSSLSSLFTCCMMILHIHPHFQCHLHSVSHQFRCSLRLCDNLLRPRYLIGQNFSADNISPGTIFFGGQNFRLKIVIPAVLSAEIFYPFYVLDILLYALMVQGNILNFV